MAANTRTLVFAQFGAMATTKLLVAPRLAGIVAHNGADAAARMARLAGGSLTA